MINTRSYLTLLAGSVLTVLIAGCGNQMYRQPNYTPLDAPRAAPPAEAVAADPSILPTDALPVASIAYGARVKLPGETEAKAVGGVRLTEFPSKEPVLPPPNLSDNALQEPAPASVNLLKNPLPDDPRVVRSGQILFYNRCVQCHNPSGYGYGTVGQYLIPNPPDLAGKQVQNFTDGGMFWGLTMGIGKMPGFRHWLTPPERWALVSYVRSLKSSKAVQDETNPDAWKVSRDAPYPTYGVKGYQDGYSANPFKTLSPPVEANDMRSTLRHQGQGQQPAVQTRPTQPGE